MSYCKPSVMAGLTLLIYWVQIGWASALPATNINADYIPADSHTLFPPLNISASLPACFTTQYPPPVPSYRSPTQEDCLHVSQLFDEEDTRREYQRSSFGSDKTFSKNDVDFTLPMYKAHETCRGGLSMRTEWMDERVWVLMKDIAHNIEWMQRSCEDKGNLGGAWKSESGIAYFVWGVEPGVVKETVFDAEAVWEGLMNATRSPSGGTELTS